VKQYLEREAGHRERLRGRHPADYIVDQTSNLVRVLTESEMPSLDTYFVYPEELRNVARIQVFRDFMIQKSQRWSH